tara:strand:+ start:14370 stop:15266 length:897 start_codon:yes stop_codon:yes gene_type:complete
MKQRKGKAAVSANKGGRIAGMFAEEEKKAEKKREQGFMPLRMWQKRSESVGVIVLDSSLEDAYAIREHNIQGSDGKWGNYERCLADSGETCPVCKKHGEESYLILFLTVLVLKEWTSKKTGDVHKYSKMLLPLKRGQFPKFNKLEQICADKHGTMRGMYIVLEREDGEQSVATGVPVPLDDGSALDFYSEEELIEEFGHKEMKNREGKVFKQENEDLEVCDYERLFPEPDAADLRERHDVKPEAGSLADNEEAFSDDSGEVEQSAPAKKVARKRTRKARKPAESETPAEGDEDYIPFD